MARSIALALLQKGLVRKNNDDNLYILDAWVMPGERNAFERSAASEEPRQFYAVTDGMGGHEVGDLAAETVLAILDQHRRRLQGGSRFDFVDFARDFVDHANSVVCQLLERYQGLTVGTTLAALIIDRETAYTISVGNSRIYLFRDGRLYCLTRDHVEYLPDQRRLTRYFGIADDTALVGAENLTRTAIQRGDIFLLTTDGITDLLSDEVLAGQLGAPAAFVQKIRQLQNLAFNAGAPDNLALIGIRILDPVGHERTERKTARNKKAQSAQKPGRPSIRQDEMMRDQLQQHRWIRPLLIFLFFVLLGILAGKLFFSIPAWLVNLLRGS
jgi:serine/threonine protein phosphatase PrpC